MHGTNHLLLTNTNTSENIRNVSKQLQLINKILVRKIIFSIVLLSETDELIGVKSKHFVKLSNLQNQSLHSAFTKRAKILKLKDAFKTSI